MTGNQLWASLAMDSGSCVALIDADGRVIFANEIAAQTAKTTVSEVTGRTIEEIFPSSIARERISFIRRVLETKRPLIVDAVFQGMYRSSVYRPVTGPGGEQLVLCVGRTGHTKPGFEPGPDMDYVRAKQDDAGQFSNLTTRELEILRLIGEGLTTADIAKRLHRSVKTVEWHRVSLGTKLGVNNRVELARLAIEAGLVSANSTPLPPSPETPEP